MNNTTKKIVRELKRQRDVNVHHNVIRFYGITKLNSENEIDQSNNYFDLNSCNILVLEKKLFPILLLIMRNFILSVGMTNQTIDRQ
ncbi:unnamed protein product [Rhizophagus irregularis]|nr:unnamed protein product [Rhizophagus irregularis]